MHDHPDAKAQVLSHFRTLIWVEALLAWVPLVLAIVYLPDHANTYVGKETGGGDEKEGEMGEEDAPLWTTVKQLLGNRSFVLLTVSCGFIQGFYSSWGASLALVLAPLGFSTSNIRNCGHIFFWGVVEINDPLGATDPLRVIESYSNES